MPELPVHKELSRWGQTHKQKYETSTEVDTTRIIQKVGQFTLPTEPESSHCRNLMGKVKISQIGGAERTF